MVRLHTSRNWDELLSSATLWKEDTDWVKKCMEYEVGAPDQEVDQRGLGERLCKKID